MYRPEALTVSPSAMFGPGHEGWIGFYNYEQISRDAISFYVHVCRKCVKPDLESAFENTR